MDSLDFGVLQTAEQWLVDGHRLVLCTVVKTWGSAPRPVGSMAVIRADGQILGSISGGCIEDDLVHRVRAGEFFSATTTPHIVQYGGSREAAQRFNLPCGGILEIVLEPMQHAGEETRWLAQLLERIAQHQMMRRVLNLQTGNVQLHSGHASDEVEYTETHLTTIFGPRYRLLLIGAGQLSYATAQMAQLLDYSVTVCDPREEYANSWDLPGTTLVRTMPDDTVLAMGVDGRTAIVALTHDPKLDDMALLEALKSSAFFVGALGSRASQRRRKERLALFDLSSDEINRLHGPVGLPINSRTPAEIAVSILAQMTAVKRHAEAVLPSWRCEEADLANSQVCATSA